MTRNKNDKLRQEMCGEDKRYIYYNLRIPQFFMKMRKYAFLQRFIKTLVEKMYNLVIDEEKIT